MKVKLFSGYNFSLQDTICEGFLTLLENTIEFHRVKVKPLLKMKKMKTERESFCNQLILSLFFASST